MTDPSRPTGAHAWRGSPAARKAAGQTDPSRKRKILIVGGVMLALAGAVAALLFYLKAEPRPVFVAVVIDQYGDPRLPVAAFADEDRKALPALGWQKSDTFNSQQRDLLLRQLRDLGRHESGDRPLVIYLRAFAASTEDGVALLPADARLDDPKSWLPLREVFEALKECPIKRRLLLLDLARPLTDARAGVLANDVAARLEPLLEAAVEKDKGLQVLTACAPGQVSLTSEELGNTVFVHYLLRGLAGRADGVLPGGKKDGQVSVAEIAAYVAAEADRWAWHNRRARQTPKLYGAGADFPLTVAEPESPKVIPLDRAYPDFLTKGWETRDGWWAKQRLQRTPPELYEKLEAALLRAEERWRAGVDSPEVRAELERTSDGLAQTRLRKMPDEPERANSLALAESRGSKAPEEKFADNRARLKEMARLSVLTAVPKPNEQDVTKLKTERDKFLKEFEGKEFDLAWTVYRVAAVEEKPGREALQFWAGLLKPEMMPLPPKLDFTEVQALLKLAAKPQQPDIWPAEEVGLALKLAGETARARVVPAHWAAWEDALDEQAEADRRAGERSLFAATPEERARAAGLLRKALAAYQRNNPYLQVVHDERRFLDEALVYLAAYPAYLEIEPARASVWKEAAATARKLDALLGQPPQKGGLAADEVLRQVKSLSAPLRDSLSNLREPIDPTHLRRLIEQRQKAGGADARDMAALLLLPAWSAGDRVRLWSAWRDLSGRLNDETTTAEAPPAFDVGKAQRPERERALLRARTALALLEQTDSADAPKVRDALEKAAAAPDAPAPWHALAAELRQAWKRGR